MSKTAMRYFLLSLLVCSTGLMLRGNVIAAPTLSVSQYTLGTPTGLSPGNPFIPGSATSYLGSLTGALDGTLVSRNKFTPKEAAVWGPSGKFGGELYFSSLVQGIPTGALLEEHKALFFTRPGQLQQTQFDVTFYFSMEAYQHTSSTLADGFTRLNFDTATGPGPHGTEGSAVNGSERTFASFGSFAGDYSDANGFTGTDNNPPPAISNLVGTVARYEATYRLIQGDWGLVGESTSSRGFRFGTGFFDLDSIPSLAVASLGNVSVTSEVVSEVPEPATFMLLGLGTFGLLGYRGRFKK